jgi:uncharacterized protein YsxB (DUF464 family)
LKELIRLSGVSKKNYLNAYNNVKSMAGISSVISVDEITVKLGCPQIREKALEVFQVYKTDLLASMSSSRQGDANFGKSVFTCAAVSSMLILGEVVRIKSH